jgi:hypothetical protein
MASPDRQQAVLQQLEAWPKLRRSVALGELADHDANSPLPQPCVGFQFAKLGTSRLMQPTLRTAHTRDWWPRWQGWYRELPLGCQGVLVAYADALNCGGLTVDSALDLAQQHRLPYVLVDTFDKSAGGLFAILQRQRQLSRICTWIQRAKQQGTRLVLAGQLDLRQITQLRQWRADVVGVRSAICEQASDGRPIRTGALCPQRLQQLLAVVGDSAST